MSALLALLTPLPAAVAPAAPPAPARTATPTPQDDPITITGTRRGDLYRLPEAFRTDPAAAGDRWRRSLALDRPCANVGPLGCGAATVPILTVGGDGALVWGEPGR